MLESLKARTGKNADDWLAELTRAKATTPAERRAYLESQKLGASTIGLIMDHCEGKTPASYNPKSLVEQLFKGPKAALLPLYESILHFALNLGDDVKACPCATIVPFYRNHVFAQLKPSTKTRLDLGLALGHANVPLQLIDTGGLAKKDRITHRLELSAASHFNDFAKDWLVRAYRADA